jgi:hypothetical protein
MKLFFVCMAIAFNGFANTSLAQSIVYSEIERADSRNLNFEILGKFDDNFLVYKNINRSHKLTIYENSMVIKETVKLDFVSERTYNIDFIKYPDYFLMVWQYEKGNTTYCKAAKMNGLGKIVGNILDLDTTKTGFFGTKTYYGFTWSENKKKILVYKTMSKNDVYHICAKVYNEDLMLQDSSRQAIPYENRESFDDMQVDNDGNVVFTKLKENARQEYINTLELNIKKAKVDKLTTINIPLEKMLIQPPVIKIDNLNAHYLINSFSYKKNGGYVDGIFSAIVSKDSFALVQKNINVFDDSLIKKLSGKPDWRSAFDNLFLKNIILKKDGGFIAVTEDYYKQRRFGGTGFDDRFGNNNVFGSTSDYYLYNRGYNGLYRPYGDNTNARDIVYNYGDILNFSFTKDLKLQWNNVINKTTNDVETDNFLSFVNMNMGAEIHFLFLQKDNNRQILSDHAVQADGSIIRYATLRSREAGYEFMAKLGRQTGARQMIIPCIVRNNIAFAKIDF